LVALAFTIENDKITAYDVIADPAHLQSLDLAVLDWPRVRTTSRRTSGRSRE
jgi:hypothetical protein